MDESKAQGWCFLTDLEVLTSANTRVLVGFGDSLTDANSFHPNPNVRWLDHLANRVPSVALANMGLSGSRLLYDDPNERGFGIGTGGLQRFDRDVLARPGVTDVIILLGTNDIGRPGPHAPANETADFSALTSNLNQLIRRARDRGLHAFLGTIPPFKFSTLSFYSPAKEAVRQAVNAWIRSRHPYVDFDSVLRNATDPERLSPNVDSGDHLHPGERGQMVMSDIVYQTLFEHHF